MAYPDDVTQVTSAITRVKTAVKGGWIFILKGGPQYYFAWRLTGADVSATLDIREMTPIPYEHKKAGKEYILAGFAPVGPDDDKDIDIYMVCAGGAGEVRMDV